MKVFSGLAMTGERRANQILRYFGAPTIGPRPYPYLDGQWHACRDGRVGPGPMRAGNALTWTVASISAAQGLSMSSMQTCHPVGVPASVSTRWG